MCPYCSDFCKQDRRAVMNHYNTDPACRRLLLADLNMQDEYLARYDFERAKVVRAGVLTPAGDPEPRLAYQCPPPVRHG